jgi:hypothetical protein
MANLGTHFENSAQAADLISAVLSGSSIGKWKKYGISDEIVRQRVGCTVSK